MGDDTAKLKLYVRLPVKIKEELDVKNLHPDILKVHLPRQKSRRWCFVDFKDRETLLKVRKELKNKTINGKKLVILPYTFAGRKGTLPKEKKLKKSSKPKKINTSVDPLLNLLKKEEKE